MSLAQLIALMAAALHGGRSADEAFGEKHAIEQDIKIAREIWLKAADE